jgi:hypothetical protein
MTYSIPPLRLPQVRGDDVDSKSCKRTRTFSRGLLTLLVVFGVTAWAPAADLVNDTWKDGTRTDPAAPVYTENGTDGDADGNLESVWYHTGGSGASMTVVDDNTPGGDQMLRTTVNATGSSTWTTYFAPSNSAIALNSVGDTFKLTWKFKPTNVNTNPAATGQDFRLCIVDSAETNRIISNTSPGNGVYPGYAMLMSMGTNLFRSTPFNLKKRSDLSATAFLSSSGVWGTDLGDDGNTGDVGYSDGVEYTFVFTATLQSGGALALSARMTGGSLGGDGELIVTNVDATPTTLSFDTFGIRPSSGNTTASTFDTTLFKVELTSGACTPTAYTVNGDATVCSGGTSVVSLSGSDVGVDYHLLVGGLSAGTILPGTGSPLNFGPQSVGTYTVYASNTTIACEGLMDGAAVVAQYADPVVTVNPSPANAVNTIGDTRVFNITATGPGLTYRWRKDGSELNNGVNISGVNTATLTLSNLTTDDNGYYDCVVSNSPCGATALSAGANLTVNSGTGILFRTASAGPGYWSDSATWEQSTGGGIWTPAAAAPSNLDSNIVIRAGHTVWVAAEHAVDQVTIEAGGVVSLQGGTLLINNGSGAVDFNVAGTLEVGGGGGSIVIGSATLQFTNGSVYNWNYPAAPAIPTATWLDGSTCRISATAASNVTATGVAGQSYYDFIYDTTVAGQSTRCRLDVKGTNTVIRRDFTITLPDTANASVTINNDTDALLTVGRHVTFNGGTTANSTKVLLNNAVGNSYTLKVGGNFTVNGYIDGFGSSSTFIVFNGTGTQSLTLPLQPNLITSSAMNWNVPGSASVQFASSIDGFNSFTNSGTLDFGPNQILRGTTLVFNSGGIVLGNGTNQLTTTNLATVVAGGTLNLGTLPTLSAGDSFLLFGAAAHSGSFSTLLPATPGSGLVWDDSQLGSAGILTASSSTPPVDPTPTNIVSSVSGGVLTLSWPATHTGWTLQVQTNTLAVGLATNWVDVPNSTSTNQVSLPIGSGNPSVFYRLQLQP